MDLLSLVRNNATAALLGLAVNQVPIPEPVPPASSVVVPEGPSRDVVEARAERAQKEWVRMADLPDEPGLYYTYDLRNRQLCHLVVSPANLKESRMEYSLHCGVDSRPKAEQAK